MNDAERSRSQDNSRAKFEGCYRAPVGTPRDAIQREVFGANTGVNGYTTIAQADGLAKRLGLGPGKRLLDVGAGEGWPGLYLARTTGCEVVATDVPVPGMRTALARAREQELLSRVDCIAASGTHLPFRAQAFDAAVHTDVLC
ncbi:MAG: class I SAM-dependent methyltransferase [Dehalococcoidia bacterium]